MAAASFCGIFDTTLPTGKMKRWRGGFECESDDGKRRVFLDTPKGSVSK